MMWVCFENEKKNYIVTMQITNRVHAERLINN